MKLKSGQIRAAGLPLATCHLPFAASARTPEPEPELDQSVHLCIRYGRNPSDLRTSFILALGSCDLRFLVALLFELFRQPESMKTDCRLLVT